MYNKEYVRINIINFNKKSNQSEYAISNIHHHRTPLVQWLLRKYKYLWDVRYKGQDSSLREKTLHTYTLKLG